MKRNINIYRLLLPLVVVSMFWLTSCEDEDGVPLEEPNGAPSISYIRVTNPEQSDSLLVRAELGAGIVIMGENLGGTREVWFNDRQANITPSWVTNHTIIVSVPSVAPLNVTNELYLVDDHLDTLAFSFEVTIPAPEIYSAVNEWPQDGEALVLNGDYFFDVTPVTVDFAGGGQVEATVVDQNTLVVPVPVGATEGAVTVTTNFGSATSTFHVWDSRNIVLNFDDLVANGWRIGMTDNTDGPIDGNYLIVGGNIGANERDEGPGAPSQSSKVMEYWGGSDPNRDSNFYPYYPNSYQEYVMKFEAKINTWYGGFLNFCLAPPTHTGSNQEIWSNSINARAIWGPWQSAGEEVSTDGKWITVVIPMTEFQYFIDAPDAIVYTPGQKFIETAAGSLSTWIIGSPENDGNYVELYIDNIRFVQP
ncbi:MAG: glycan-binding surface protein [Marinoscillum sp.]